MIYANGDQIKHLISWQKLKIQSVYWQKLYNQLFYFSILSAIWIDLSP